MKPILFSTPMVQAILAGQKTMTRRVIKPQPTYSERDGFSWKGAAYGTDIPPTTKGAAYNFRCAAKYQPGDILWVRETSWISECGKYLAQGEPTSHAEIVSLETGRRWKWENTTGDYAITDSMITSWSWEGRYKRGGNRTEDFSVTFADVDTTVKIEMFTGNIIKRKYEALFRKKLPSIFMPREAARIFLRVTNVRAERVQDITVEDVISEGLEADNEIRNPDPDTHESIKCWNLEWAHFVFRELWDNLNKKRGYGWDTNPWVWVYEFERTEAKI